MYMAPNTFKKFCVSKAHKLFEENKGEIYYCNGCRRDGQGLTYRCSTCKCYLHEACMNFKKRVWPEMFEKDKDSYNFKFVRSLDGRQRRHCEACGALVEGFAYRCTLTDKALHPNCVGLKKKIEKDETGVEFELRPGGVTLNSCDKHCCNLCQSADLPAAAGHVHQEMTPGWCYVSDDGSISFHVFCLMRFWFRKAAAAAATKEEDKDNKGGDPKLHFTETHQDIISYSKRNQGGAGEGSSSISRAVATKVSGNYPKPHQGGGCWGADKLTIGKNKKKAGRRGWEWGGRKTEICIKILESVLVAVISTLIGDVTGGFIGHELVELVKELFQF